MKKIYIAPGMTVVKLQHHSIICDSLRGMANGAVGYGGRSSDNTDGNNNINNFARTKESSGIWDDEW